MPAAETGAPSRDPASRPWFVSTRINLGTYQDVDDLRQTLDRVRIKVGLSANAILGTSAFAIGTAEKAAKLVVISVAELGFGDEGATLADIYARAAALGLELCPPQVGPQFRLQYLNQPVGEWLHIAMAPIALEDGTLADFTVANGGAGLMLLGGEARPDLVMPAAVKFVFMMPRRSPTVVSR
jgi:hypothetical protein